MKSDQPKDFNYARTQFFTDYGMALVLLLLCALFSGLTIKEQHPTGSVAGEQVAKRILADQPDANVLIVARGTSEDRDFSGAANRILEDQGATVLGSINGEPGDVRRMLQEILERKETVDAIAATDVTAKWSVYDRFDSVGSEKCVTPRSYQWPVFLKHARESPRSTHALPTGSTRSETCNACLLSCITESCWDELHAYSSSSTFYCC